MISHSLVSTYKHYSWEQHHPEYTLKNPTEIQQRGDLGLTYSNGSALFFCLLKIVPRRWTGTLATSITAGNSCSARHLLCGKPASPAHSQTPKAAVWPTRQQLLHKFTQTQFAKYILNIWTHQILSGLFLQWSTSSASENSQYLLLLFEENRHELFYLENSEKQNKTIQLNFSLLSNLSSLEAEVTSPTVLARDNQRSHSAAGNCGQQLPLGCGSLGEDEDGQCHLPEPLTNVTTRWHQGNERPQSSARL